LYTIGEMLSEAMKGILHAWAVSLGHALLQVYVEPLVKEMMDGMTDKVSLEGDLSAAILCNYRFIATDRLNSIPIHILLSCSLFYQILIISGQ
jgi:hypothetical protein